MTELFVNNACFRSSYLFWVGKTGEERNLIIVRDKPIDNHISPQQPNALECLVKRNSKDFLNKLRNFKLWKMPKLLNFRFSEWWYFWNCDNTEL